MVKIALIKSENFNEENHLETIRSFFQDVEVGEDNYKKVVAFDHYIDETKFDKVFESAEDYEKWLLEYEWKYFLIPVELTPAIGHYADFVKQTFPDEIFDVVLETEEVTVEGEMVTVPVNSIKIIPCNCTHWTDEGLMVLDAVIENWNVTYPNKAINFQYAFESYELFKQFRDEQVQVL